MQPESEKITRKSGAVERKDDFSDFFLHASPVEKAKLIKEVMEEASEEQRRLMKKYKRLI